MISCVLLAAGESKRFGSPKPLAKIHDETVIEYLQKKLLSTKLSEIIIVLGSQADKIKPLILKGARIKTILNENYKLGQTSSFKAGLNAIQPEIQGIMLLPVDSPFIKKETFDLLIDNFLKNRPLILLPAYNNKNGHPPIFSGKLLSEFKKLKNDEPLYTIQHNHASGILKVNITDQGAIQSFNTQKELLSLLMPSKPSAE